MASANQLQLLEQPINRLGRDLDALVAQDARIGLAVSGGPDSLALLLLAARARPLQVEAATVDHSLRPESRQEAEMVQKLCAELGVPHRILAANWGSKPSAAIQERARKMRYRLLGAWAQERGLHALLTAHHLDDQVETFLMRLSRGAGVRGLASIRRESRLLAMPVSIVRPLLGWRHSELVAVCEASGVAPVADPSNHDDRFERVRMRKSIAETGWIDAQAIGRSAAHLAEAEDALAWATNLEWQRAVVQADDHILYRPGGAPREIRRRIIGQAILRLATEGGAELRGRELQQIEDALGTGQRATLRGVLCIGGRAWRFTRAPARH